MTRAEVLEVANCGYYTLWFVMGVKHSAIPTDKITRNLLDTLSGLWNNALPSPDTQEWANYIDNNLLNELGINIIYLGGE